jgi:ABC-type glycerol-3-phosphate transport system substrate-binding protein
VAEAPATEASADNAEAAPTVEVAPEEGPEGGTIMAFGTVSDELEFGVIFDRYREAFPHMQLEYSNLTSERFAELFTAIRNSGEQIDVMLLNGQDLRRYALAGELVDLTDVVTFQDRFREIGLSTYTVNDSLWALPWGNIGGFAIFYNRHALEEIGEAFPETYEDLVRIGELLREQGRDTFTHAGQNIYVWPVWFFSTYAQVTNGMSLEYTIDTLQGRRRFDDPEVVEALDLIFNFARDGLFIQGINSTDNDGSLANMITGRAAFALGLNWRNVRAVADPDMVEIGVGLLPFLTPDRAQPQYPGGSGMAIAIHSSVTPERLQNSLDFIEFITNDENIQWLANELDWMTPTNVGIYNQRPDPLIEHFAYHIAEHQVTYLDWYWPPEITRAFQEAIQAGVALHITAVEAAAQIQDEFDRLVAGGFEFVD